MVNERAYKYLFQAGIKIYYPMKLRRAMLALTVMDFFIVDEANEDSKLFKNEWFVICKADKFYFDCIELLKKNKKYYIDAYSIGNVEDKLVCIHLKGVRREANEALIYSEYSYVP